MGLLRNCSRCRSKAHYRPQANRLTGGLFGLLVLLSLASCVTIPIQEMSDARQAINSAEEAGGREYAAFSLQKADQQLLAAEQALRSKHYTDAREAAHEAKANGQRARNLANRFGRTIALMNAARQDGVDGLPEDQLLQAKASAAIGDEAAAIDRLRQIETSVALAQKRHYQRQAGQLIGELGTNERIMSLPQQSALQAARDALGDGSYQHAWNIARSLAHEMRVQIGEGG